MTGLVDFRRLSVVIATILVIAGTVVACGDDRRNDAEFLTLGWVVDPSWAQVPVAKDLGLFTQKNVNVKIVPFPTGAAALEALAGGAVDIANGGDVPTAAAVLKNPRIRVIADGSRWPEGRFVARRSAGISSIADLAGRKIAVPLGSSAHFFASKFLADAHTEANLVHTGPAEIVTALVNKDVDAIAVFQPALSKAIDALGGDAVELQGPQKYNQHSLFLASTDAIDTKKSAVSRFVAAVAQADGPLTQRKPEALEAVSKAVGLDPRLIAVVTAEFEYKTGIGAELAPDLADRARWAQGIGRIPADQKLPDYQSVIVSSFVPASHR